jgi:hypothetical protein
MHCTGHRAVLARARCRQCRAAHGPCQKAVPRAVLSAHGPFGNLYPPRKCADRPTPPISLCFSPVAMPGACRLGDRGALARVYNEHSETLRGPRVLMRWTASWRPPSRWRCPTHELWRGMLGAMRALEAETALRRRRDSCVVRVCAPGIAGERRHHEALPPR